MFRRWKVLKCCKVPFVWSYWKSSLMVCPRHHSHTNPIIFINSQVCLNLETLKRKFVFLFFCANVKVNFFFASIKATFWSFSLMSFLFHTSPPFDQNNHTWSGSLKQTTMWICTDRMRYRQSYVGERCFKMARTTNFVLILCTFWISTLLIRKTKNSSHEQWCIAIVKLII